MADDGLTGRELDREVFLRLLCQLVGPIMAPGEGLAEIRKLEGKFREELSKSSTQFEGDCYTLCTKGVGHEGPCSGQAERPPWPAFNHSREDSPLHPCEACQGAVLRVVEWLEGFNARVLEELRLLRGRT